jgi:Ser/Thr protein kinase RdoA (MazF antagonist)
MFQVSQGEIQSILNRFGVTEPLTQWEELLNYHYEKHDPASKEVRVIGKCSFADRPPLVLKFKQEHDVTPELLNAQITFSEHLGQSGVPTARYFSGETGYVLPQTLGDYPVLVTLEEFQPGEVTLMTPSLAEKTGMLLANTHQIAERDQCHVTAPVLFDPFQWNDLFDPELFLETQPQWAGESARRYERIVSAYERHLAALSPLRQRPRYAVQGDISICNLFLTQDGQLGLFDFNRCGDNVLFCDAVMQGVFTARLMDYDHPLTEEENRAYFAAFLRGYQRVRPFSAQERALLPHLCAIIWAFWRMDLLFKEDSLLHLLEQGRMAEAEKALEKIEAQIGGAVSFL